MVAHRSRSALVSSSAALTTAERDECGDEQPDEHEGGESSPMWMCRYGPEHAGGFGQHFHRQHQLAWVSAGTMSAFVDDEAWVVPTNRAVWLPSGCRHDVITRAGSTLHCLYVWPEACPLRWERPTMLAVSPMLRELLLLLTEGCDETMVSEAAGALLFSLLESVSTPTLPLPMPRDEPTRSIAEQLLASPHSSVGLEHWAERHHVGVSTLRRRFVVETGLTFSEWRRQARLHASLDLLADGLTVERVAARVGYASANGFIDAFKRHFGATPDRHRHRT